MQKITWRQSKTWILSLLFAGMLLLPVAVSAQFGGSAVDQGLGQLGSQPGVPTQVLGTSAAGFSGNSFATVVGRIINIMLLVAGIIAVVFVIIGGYQYMTSLGNDEQAKKGRSTLINALIGLAIIILAYVMVTVVANIVQRGV